jgi:hypothetical protein
VSTILAVCPSHRDARELAPLAERKGFTLLFHDYASLSLEELVVEQPAVDAGIDDPESEIARILARYADRGIAGVVSTDDYPGSTLASIVAQALGLPGVTPAVNLLCQHKYHSRLAQRQWAPGAVPEFRFLDGAAAGLHFPVFVKPVKSFFSVGAFPAASPAELKTILPRCTLPDAFFKPFRMLFERHTGLPFGDSCLIAESLLKGTQVTLEGYIYRGELQVLGVVDSIMYPGTLAFQRFEYPSSLPAAVQQHMAEVARQVMLGIGYDNGMFNIEFMHDAVTGAIHIIEINPRMASQFADLFEKVDGTNSYSILFDLATGRRPQPLHRMGRHRMAASCVLRRFEDAQVLRVPTSDEVERLRRLFPDLRVEILATQGKALSQEMQDGRSYRYGVINIGGHDRNEVLASFAHFQRHLRFEFGPAPRRKCRRIRNAALPPTGVDSAIRSGHP